MNAISDDTQMLAYAGASILGSGELAAKTFATWLPAPVESVLRGGVWVHRALEPRLPQHQVNAPAPAYVLGRSLCTRCGNEGTLKAEGIYDGCPDCPTGREVRQQLAEIRTAQSATPTHWCIAHGTDLWDDDETCEYCEAEQ